MGIKFKNKVSLGKPAGGEIAERELVLNLKDREVYSSTDGADVIKITGDPEKGGIVWDTSTSYEIGDIVTHLEKIYISKTINTGKTPFTATANWAALPEERGGLAWDSGVKYKVGDTTVHLGKVFVCVTAHTAAATWAANATKWSNDIIVDPGWI